MIKGFLIITIKPLKISYFIIAGFISLSAVAFTYRDAIAKQLDQQQLLPQPERLTELYFLDYHQLPAVLTSNRPQKIAFTVHNLEHQTVTYRYRLTATSAKTEIEQKLGDGTFTLEHDQSEATTRDFTIPSADTRVMIKVTIDYQELAAVSPIPQTQSIDFWTNVTDPLSSSKVNHEGS